MILFKHFTVYDQKDSHQSVNKLIERLFGDIKDKS